MNRHPLKTPTLKLIGIKWCDRKTFLRQSIIVTPAEFPDKLHKTAVSGLFTDYLAIRTLYNPYKHLFPLVADRDNQPAARVELLNKMSRDIGSACRNQDSVKGSFTLPAAGVVLDLQVYIQ